MHLLLEGFLMGDLLEAMELYDGCLEGAAEDYSCISALAEQPVEFVLRLVDPTHFEESFELNMSN